MDFSRLGWDVESPGKLVEILMLRKPDEVVATQYGSTFGKLGQVTRPRAPRNDILAGN